MRKWLMDQLSLNKREFNGLMVLLGGILVATSFPMVYQLWRPVDTEQAIRQTAIDELGKAMAREKRKPQAAVRKTFSNPPRKAGPAPRLFSFDPNTLGIDGWEQLGFSTKQAQSILKYRDKGGQFRKVEDLQRLYVVSAERYEQLRPYVAIKTTSPAVEKTIPLVEKTSLTPFRGKPASTYVKRAKVLVEINGADTLELDKIVGIGPAFARRIVNYRDRVGGFYKKEQLMEVFGLDSVKFREIEAQVLIDVSRVKKLNINTVKVDDFKNHPYLRYKQVNAIIQYREQHGNYGNFDDLKKVAILTPELVERLAPYISF